ncbi:hypothetical protein Tco_0006282 [Tanacetum coccineum]
MVSSELTKKFECASLVGIFLINTNQAASRLLEDKVLLKLDWAKNQKTKSSLKKTVAFADEGSSNSDTDKIMARMDAMTMKMDAQNVHGSQNSIEKICQTSFKFNSKSGKPSLTTCLNKLLVDHLDSLPSTSTTQRTNSKATTASCSRNEHVNVVFTRSGKSYNLSVNPNDKQTNSETPINFDSDDEDKEPTSQPKNQNPKPVKETPLPKPYKLKIPYPQRLRKEKMEAIRIFIDVIRCSSIQ